MKFQNLRILKKNINVKLKSEFDSYIFLHAMRTTRRDCSISLIQELPVFKVSKVFQLTKNQLKTEQKLKSPNVSGLIPTIPGYVLYRANLHVSSSKKRCSPTYASHHARLYFSLCTMCIERETWTFYLS